MGTPILLLLLLSLLILSRLLLITISLTIPGTFCHFFFTGNRENGQLGLLEVTVRESLRGHLWVKGEICCPWIFYVCFSFPETHFSFLLYPMNSTVEPSLDDIAWTSMKQYSHFGNINYGMNIHNTVLIISLHMY